MAGEEQESNPASGEPRESTKHMLLQLRSRSARQPGESPERHLKHGYDARLHQSVLLAASIFLIKPELDGMKMLFEFPFQITNSTFSPSLLDPGKEFRLCLFARKLH